MHEAVGTRGVVLDEQVCADMEERVEFLGVRFAYGTLAVKHLGRKAFPVRDNLSNRTGH